MSPSLGQRRDGLFYRLPVFQGPSSSFLVPLLVLSNNPGWRCEDKPPAPADDGNSKMWEGGGGEGGGGKGEVGSITGRSCHKDHFCRDKGFVTNVCFSRQNSAFVATKICLSRQNYACRDRTFVATNTYSSRQNFCLDKYF